MGAKLRFTLLFAIFLLLTLIAVAGLVYFLRLLTQEFAKNEDDSDKKHWWRYVCPTFVAVFFSYWMPTPGDSLLWNYCFFVVFCIGVPFGLAFVFLRDTLENRKERISMLFSLLLFLHASAFASMWYFHFRHAHAEEIDAGTFENNHLMSRNYFFIPIWILAIFFGAGSTWLWRKAESEKKESEGSFWLWRKGDSERTESRGYLCAV